MKLTEEQIQRVKDYINNNEIEYIDLHLEILDHISSDIEELMKADKNDFEFAFEQVKTKWNKNFAFSASYWLGPFVGGSKLFIDKCLKTYKSVLFKSILGICLFTLCFYGLKNLFKIEMDAIYPILKISFLVMLVVFPAFLLFWRHQIKGSKLKSTFSHLFNKLILAHILASVVLLAQILEIFQNYDFIYISFFPIILSILYIGYIFYKQHLNTVLFYKKYELK